MLCYISIFQWCLYIFINEKVLNRKAKLCKQPNPSKNPKECLLCIVVVTMLILARIKRFHLSWLNDEKITVLFIMRILMHISIFNMIRYVKTLLM